MLLDPELKLGEAYMDGTLVVEQGSIADLLDLVLGAGSQWQAAAIGRGSQWLLRYL